MQSRRTRALSIPSAVRERVRARDGCCVLCFLKRGVFNVRGLECAHYIGRGQSGLGIEENLVMLCPDCHRETDQSAEREANRKMIAEYLRNKYDGWDDIPKTYNRWL